MTSSPPFLSAYRRINCTKFPGPRSPCTRCSPADRPHSFYKITVCPEARRKPELILQFCSKIIGQEFEDLLLEHDILSFIRDLGHFRDIIYLSDVSFDYLHQPWRAFATIINKCLSGKETGMDKIRLSHAQILWGMFYKKNIDYVYLLWEDLLFQIENKDAKKTNKMSYPRFTKIIIDYFMSKDQSISRNKMFWHTARDDTMFTSMRCISRHEDTQLATKRSKTRFHSSHESGSGDGVDTQSKVPDEQHLKTTGADEGTSTIPCVPDVPIYKYESEKESWGDSEDEDNENDSDDLSDEGDDDNDANNGNDDNDDANDGDKQESDDTNDDDEETDSDRTEKRRKINDEETLDQEEDDEVTKELYDDVNVNLGNEDTKMTNADQGALEQQNADEPVQSYYVSSDFTSKLLNLKNPSPADNEIASLLDTTTHRTTAIPEITSSFTTNIPPPPPFFNPLS
ncbi:hypothetical protein Tco_1212748 [Tanacetum coccineum]